MVNNFHMPPTGYGPGSQPLPEEDEGLEYLPMPSGMNTFSAHIPDLDDKGKFRPALLILEQIQQACLTCSTDLEPRRVDLRMLDAANRALIAETFGDGEVSVKMAGNPAILAQESVFAGIWQVSGMDMDFAEIAPFPSSGYIRAFNSKRPAIGVLAQKSDEVVNAPSILTEILDNSITEPKKTYSINLTLLPHTEADLAYLDEALGEGSVDILSRGYGNCRVRATGQKYVWRVQYFNSMDTLILDSFEITQMPEVVVAAQEDLDDSAKRLGEVIGAIR